VVKFIPHRHIILSILLKIKENTKKNLGEIYLNP